MGAFGLLAVSASPAAADHVVYRGASIEAREVAPAADGRPRVRVSWRINCSNATIFGGVAALYSYDRDRVISTLMLPMSSGSGSRVTIETVGAGRYKPELIGPSCGMVADGSGHFDVGPEVVDGPDFLVCNGLPAAVSAASWPVIAVPRGCESGKKKDCKRATGSTAWPVIAIPDGCEPPCRPGAGTSTAWPMIAVDQRCDPVRMRKDKAPVPVKCPGGGSASTAWPLIAVSPCRGKVRLDSDRPVPCAGSSTAWPLIPVAHCSAATRKRVRLGRASFRLRAGKAGLVPVKLGRKARRFVRSRKRVPIRATIVVRQGKQRTRTVRRFVLRAH